ncbi:MAG: hypothetical protein ACYS0K_06330 [Planctomycetota bacterium]|jgi:hypothetical protein
MRRLAVLCLLVAGCVAPFWRGTYDNRPDDAVAIAEVHDDGRIVLADGTTVRLFGVRVPADLLREHEGKKVSVETLLPTDPPAVELCVWHRFGYCGNGLMTWNPFAAPYESFMGYLIVVNSARYYPPREADLSHPDAPAELVAEMRERFAQRRAEIERMQGRQR